MKFLSALTRADAVCICDESGSTLWTRSGTFPLSQAINAYKHHAAEQPGVVTLFRSMADRFGQEQYAMIVPPKTLEYLEEGGRKLITVQAWYQGDRDRGSLKESEYRLAAEFVLPEEDPGPVLTTDDLLETVFDLTQNLENSWNTPAKNRLHRQWAMRSSMVGDVFCIRSENKFWIYLVAPVGFILLDASSLDELGSVLNSDEVIKQAVAKNQQEKAAP